MLFPVLLLLLPFFRFVICVRRFSILLLFFNTSSSSVLLAAAKSAIVALSDADACAKFANDFAVSSTNKSICSVSVILIRRGYYLW